MGNSLNSHVGKNIVDNMIEQEICDPLIIACLGYTSGNATNNDLIASTLREDILPYIAKNFATYAECNPTDGVNTIKTKIKEQRDHFGAAGLSRGASATQFLMAQCLDYFSYFGVFSGYLTNYQEPGNTPDINYAYFTVGSSDSTSGNCMRTAYNIIKEKPFVKKCDFNVLSGGHDWSVWHASLYNALQLFFDY